MDRSRFAGRRSLLRWLPTLLAGTTWSAASAGGETDAPMPPPEIAAAWPQARLQGQGRLSFFGMHIYDARLWVDAVFTADTFERRSFALELTYGRSLDGRRIAERSLAEMQKIGPPTDAQAARWLQQMMAIFPDVARGDRLTGWHRPGEPVRFFLNGRTRGDIPDPEFAKLFFGIWLAPRSSEPALRQALLGAAPGRP